MTSREQPSVLVVEDDPDLADAYAIQLEGEYDISTVYGGRAALDALDPSIDVVLLDRHMPDVSGDDVLDALRERGLDCRVAMVTAVDPDFDVIDLPFDDYVTKPVSRADLLATVERLCACAAYEDRMREYYSLSAKRAALSANKSGAELVANERFQELERRLSEIEAELDQTVAGFDDADFDAVFRSLGDRVATPTER